MDATYIQKSIEQLKTNIFMHVRHRTLLRYTGEPVLNENQLFYLLLPFFNGENWSDKLNSSIITVGIVHASLNEHEKISELDAVSKEQQLTVLSGDYYSGRYYAILAESGNVKLIKKVSEGIANRCENQVRIYETKSYSFNQWLESLKVIETDLIKKFYDTYDFYQYTPIMQTSLLILRLQEEFHKHSKGQHTPFLKKMMDSLSVHEGDLQINSIIQKQIDVLANNLHDYLQSSDTINDDLKQYIEQLVLGGLKR